MNRKKASAQILPCYVKQFYYHGNQGSHVPTQLCVYATFHKPRMLNEGTGGSVGRCRDRPVTSSMRVTD